LEAAFAFWSYLAYICAKHAIVSANQQWCPVLLLPKLKQKLLTQGCLTSSSLVRPPKTSIIYNM